MGTLGKGLDDPCLIKARAVRRLRLEEGVVRTNSLGEPLVQRPTFERGRVGLGSDPHKLMREATADIPILLSDFCPSDPYCVALGKSLSFPCLGATR